MSQTMHTPEPWNRDTHKVYRNPDSDRELPIEDYERAFPCVNACAGMTDPAAEITRLRAELAEAREAVGVLAEGIKAVRLQRTHEYEKGLVPGGDVLPIMEQACRNILNNPIAASAVKKAGGGA